MFLSGRDQKVNSSFDERIAWRRALAAGLGTMVEYYDFQLFGIMSVFLGPVFFPGSGRETALLSTLAVFGGAFLARPIGGYIFGLIGDTRGRRVALLITVFGMGVASAATGLLPSANQAGLAAPVLLLLLRLAQGFFAGGEVTGAATYISESAPPGRRAFFGAFNPAAAVFGLTLATGISAIVEASIGSEAMAHWGWRLPFLLSVPLIIVCLWVRSALQESPGFKHDTVHLKSARQPILVVLSEFKKPLLLLVVLAFAQNVAAYMSLLFLSIQLTHSLGYNGVEVSRLIAVVSFVAGMVMPWIGALSDRLGRRPVLGMGFLGYVFLAPLTLYVAEFGHMSWTALAVFVGCIPLVFVQATAYPLYTELFPTHVRYTGMSLGFNIATIFGGGTSPYLGAWFVEKTHSNISPSIYVSLISILALISIFFLKETAT